MKVKDGVRSAVWGVREGGEEGVGLYGDSRRREESYQRSNSFSTVRVR